MTYIQQPGRAKNALRLAGLALPALGLAAVALSQADPASAPQPEPAAPSAKRAPVQPGFIQLETIKIDILADDRLSYRVEANHGTLNEETREIEMEKPSVSVYGEDQLVKDRASGFRGKVWPVKLQTKDEKTGLVEENTRYDWALEGGVSLEASQGARVTGMEMRYSNERQTIGSPRPVEYRLPSGKGSHFVGDAEQFEVVIDPATRKPSKWTLGGRVNLTAEIEK